jgi:multiple sugar transport system permease protein
VNTVQAASAEHAGRRRGLLLRTRWGVTAAQFLGPFCAAFVLFFLLPIGYAIYKSMFSTRRVGGIFGTPVQVFSGLSQYKAVLTSSVFIDGILRVVLYTAIWVPCVAIIATVLALVLDATAPKIAGFFRTMFFLPYAVPSVIAAIMWGSLYTPAVSPMKDFGLDINFLGSGLVLPSIANIGIWASTGFYVILVTTALTSIPHEVFEAARVDGASDWKVAWSIKFPLIRPTIVMSMVLAIIWTLQLFTEPTVLHSLSPAVTTDYTPTMMAYDTLTGGNFSFAAAISVTLAAAGLVISLAFIRIARRVAQ